MSLAEETRAAVRARPALYDALQAGVLNYAAAARHLDIGEDPEAVATALRRFEDRLTEDRPDGWDVRVRMNRVRADDDGPITVGDASFAPGDGTFTAVLATGAVDPQALEHVLGVMRTNGVVPEAAGVAGGSMAIVVKRRSGANAVRLVESALSD